MTQPVSYYPYPPPQPGPWDRDASHLNTLAICHYVWGAVTTLFSSIFIIYIVMGVAFLNAPGAFMPPAPPPASPSTAPMTMPAMQPLAAPPPFLGWMFIGMGSCFLTLGWTSGILTIVSGRCLHRRRSRVFSLVMAGVNCLSVPIGTTLGVFTFIVLLRPSVQALYDQHRPAAG